jgi:small subunit ribosomal protein S18
LADYERNDAETEPQQERRPARYSGGDDRQEGYGARGGYRGRDNRRRIRICQFCADKTKVIDYKDFGLLRQFVGERGRISSRRKTSTCARHQRMLARAIKRARYMALLPYAAEHVRV